MHNICILYNAGSYGTFIEWCLNLFSDPEFSKDMPFTESGNSHNFTGNYLSDLGTLKKHIEVNKTINIARLHPKNSISDSIVDVMNFVKQNFEHTIYIHPTFDSVLWNINNKFTKTSKENWLDFTDSKLLENLIRCGINDPNLDLEEAWKFREFLSYHIFEQHISECELDHLNELKLQFPNSLFISTDDLRDNFKSTIINLLEYTNLTLINEDLLDTIFKNWIQTQYHANKDNLIKEIVDYILADKWYDWHNKNLTIIDESFIQMKLRSNGIEIKCFELNTFPTNTQDLKTLLYAT